MRRQEPPTRGRSHLGVGAAAEISEVRSTLSVSTVFETQERDNNYRKGEIKKSASNQ